MTHAYNEWYLNDAMQNLGEMVEYAVHDLGYKPDQFFGWFLSSGIAEQFGKGNPKYTAGMSGIELVEAVLSETGISYKNHNSSRSELFGQEYWAGWILAYYQWESGKRFEDIVKGGLPLSKVFSMHILHEADESKFVDAANKILERNKETKKSRLAEIRKARGYTQQQLSDASGTSLRMIQLYEQRRNDIRKAQVKEIVGLARALGCDIEDLIS